MYNILTASSQAELINMVNNAIQEGWKPFGSLSVIYWENPDGPSETRFWEYNQPMIKDTPDAPNQN